MINFLERRMKEGRGFERKQDENKANLSVYLKAEENPGHKTSHSESQIQYA